MSAEQVSILISAVDNATATLEKINGSVQKLGVQMESTATKSETLNTSMKSTGMSAKEAVYSFAALGTAAMNLYYAYDRISDAQRNIEKADLRLDKAQKRLTDLMIEYDKACKDTTADVEKLARAELTRDKAQQGVSKANDAVFEAQRNLNIAIRETGSFSYDTMKAQKDLQYAIENVDFAQREFGFAETDLTKTSTDKGAESEQAKNLLEQIKLQEDTVDIQSQMLDEMRQRKDEAWVTAIISVPLSLTTIIGSLAMIYSAIVGKGVAGTATQIATGAGGAAAGTGITSTILGASGAGGATATGVLATAGGIGAASLGAMGAATLGVAMIGGYGFAVQEQQRRLGMALTVWESGGEKGPVPEGATPEQIASVRKEYAAMNAIPEISNPVAAFDRASSEIAALSTVKYVSLPAKMQAQSTAFADMANVIVGTSTKQSEVLSKMVGVETKFSLDEQQIKSFESITRSKMSSLPAGAEGAVIDSGPTQMLVGEKGTEILAPIAKMEAAEREFFERSGLAQYFNESNQANTNNSAVDNISENNSSSTSNSPRVLNAYNSKRSLGFTQTLMAKLPHLETGGVVKEETMLIAGEKGRKEAVVPLDQYVVSRRDEAQSSYSQNITVPITINAQVHNGQDIKALAREVSLEISSELRRRRR